MEVAIMASLFAIRDMNVNTSQYSTFDVKIIVFEKLTRHPDPSVVGNQYVCPAKILSN
jgi:hypothetical protein